MDPSVKCSVVLREATPSLDPSTAVVSSLSLALILQSIDPASLLIGHRRLMVVSTNYIYHICLSYNKSPVTGLQAGAECENVPTNCTCGTECGAWLGTDEGTWTRPESAGLHCLHSPPLAEGQPCDYGRLVGPCQDGLVCSRETGKCQGRDYCTVLHIYSNMYNCSFTSWWRVLVPVSRRYWAVYYWRGVLALAA